MLDVRDDTDSDDRFWGLFQIELIGVGASCTPVLEVWNSNDSCDNFRGSVPNGIDWDVTIVYPRDVPC